MWLQLYIWLSLPLSVLTTFFSILMLALRLLVFKNATGLYYLAIIPFLLLLDGSQIHSIYICMKWKSNFTETAGVARNNSAVNPSRLRFLRTVMVQMTSFLFEGGWRFIHERWNFTEGYTSQNHGEVFPPSFVTFLPNFSTLHSSAS